MKRTVSNSATFLFFYFQNCFIYNFILFKFVVETKLFEAWAYCLQASFIFFQMICFGLCSMENVSIFKLIQNPAFLFIHKFSTELTELVNQEIIFMKTTSEWVVGYIIRSFGD